MIMCIKIQIILLRVDIGILISNDASIKSANVNLTIEPFLVVSVKGYVFSLGIPIGGYTKNSIAPFPTWLGFTYYKSEYIIYCFMPKDFNDKGEFTDYPMIGTASATIFYI